MACTYRQRFLVEGKRSKRAVSEAQKVVWKAAALLGCTLNLSHKVNILPVTALSTSLLVAIRFEYLQVRNSATIRPRRLSIAQSSWFGADWLDERDRSS
jgi:hypothetical protein